MLQQRVHRAVGNYSYHLHRIFRLATLFCQSSGGTSNSADHEGVTC
jgi:hypothetical protein